LQDSTVRTDLLHNGTISSKQALSAMVKNAGAVAGINGDFFDIGKTNAPLGVEIHGNNIIKSSHNWNQSIGITNDGLGFISRILFGGAIKNITSNAELPLHGVNEVKPVPGQIVLYNSAWGHASRTGLISTKVPFTEVVIKNNVVAEILDNNLYPNSLDANTTVLLGLGEAANQLKASFAAGNQVEVIYGSNPDFNQIRFALSGDVLIVENGKPVSHPSNPYSHPRTAVGFDQYNKKMYVAVIEGRYDGSRGMTYDELGTFMASLGAWNAINLDSGGSSELVARPLADTAPVIANRPSEGTERQIPNGIGFWSTAPTGNLAGFVLKPFQNQNRVFQGFTRSIAASAYDEYYNPLSGDFNPAWSTKISSPGAGIGSFPVNGIFKGEQIGKTTVTAEKDGKTGSIEMQVIGKPIQIYPSIRTMDLTSGQTASFTIKGMDANGYEAVIEPRDIALKYDQTLLEIKPTADGRFTVKPLNNSFSTIIEITAGDLQTAIGVTAGTEQQIINTFDDAAQWSFVNLPAETTGSVSLTQAEGRGNVLKLDYDFTKTDTTRMADIKAEPSPIELPGQPKRVGVSVNGDNAHGEWLRMTLRDATGKPFYIDLARTIDWKGWKYVSASVPSGVVYPVKLDRIYLVEKDAAKKFTGYILVDDLTVEYAKTVDLPQEQMIDELILSSWDSLPSDAPKFAVVSGLELKENAGIIASIRNRQLLRELSREGLDFVIFNGGLVAADTPENYEYAKKFLDENLKIPYYAVPGRQDVAGTNSLNSFTETFGSDYQKIDIDGTRFIMLNSALGSLRASNPAQWQALIQWLKDSKEDVTIKNIVLVNQAALNLPSVLPGNGSNSYDNKLLEELLTEVFENSGKNITYISSGSKEPAVKRHNGAAYIDTGYTPAPSIDTGLTAIPSSAIFGINPSSDGNASIVVKFTP
jgi:hypothetical protein